MSKHLTKSRRQGMRELRAGDKKYVRKIDRLAAEQDAEERRDEKLLKRKRKPC